MTPGPANGTPAVPSRNALRVLRKLALAGSTVGSFCTVAAITYDVHRRVAVAERIVENKRALQTSAPRYDATSAAQRLSRMMEAAEAGEFKSIEAWKEEERKFRRSHLLRPQDDTGLSPADQDSHDTSIPIINPSTTAGTGSEPGTSVPLEGTAIEASKPDTLEGNAHNHFPSPRPALPAETREKYVLRQSDPSDTFAALEEGEALGMDKEDSLTERLQSLLDRGRIIDGAQIFLDEHPASVRGISSLRREIVVHLFYLNCKQENVFLARSIFERLEDIDRVSPTMWSILIVALARQGCVESAATVYERYRIRFNVPHYMLDVVLRCLLESQRLTSAKWLLLKHLQDDRNCGLSGAYLSGLWKKTRSIELLNGQFKKLLLMHRRLRRGVSRKLFNPVIKAYVDTGRFSDAEALVHEMETTYRVTPACRTRGLLLYGKALQHDWRAVEEGFEEMHGLGMTKSADFVKIFDRIFLEYWPLRSGAEIRDFLRRHIDTLDVIPDDVLYRHIMEAIVQRGDEAMLFEFADMASQRSWKVSPFDKDEYVKQLRERQAAADTSPVSFWQMLRAAQEHHKRLTLSESFVGYSQDSHQPESLNANPDDLQFPMSWYHTTLEELTQPSRPVDQFQKLHKRMYHYMHAGKMAEALECFEGAVNANHELNQVHVELAVIATVLELGLDAAQKLVKENLPSFQPNDHLPIFFRQVIAVDPSAEAEITKLAIFRFYHLCWWNRRSTVKHNILTSTVRRLVESNKPGIALDLLVAVYMSKYGRAVSFDGVCMKMFLRVFAALDNLAGIRWCLLTAFARGSALNRDFMVEVYRVLGMLERDYNSSSSEAPLHLDDLKKLSVFQEIEQVPNWREVKGQPNWRESEVALRRMEALRYLTFVARRLGKKCAGQDFLDVKSNPSAKKSLRRALKRPLNGREFVRFTNLVQDVELWDEEFELDKVLGRIDLDENSIQAKWNENACQEELEPSPKDVLL
ncbi:hypothetical protein BJX61DRAFT_439249 [Aspergillus egyptiacus]|nr:hypothetical protein BJX61DRAFT_439249 [Aspergillus egyptiacus]